MSIFIPIAAVAILDMYDGIQKKAWKRVGVFLLALGASFMITQARMVDKSWNGDYVNAGDAALKMKDYERALQYYQRALKTDPNAIKANHLPPEG